MVNIAKFNVLGMWKAPIFIYFIEMVAIMLVLC